MAEKVVIGNATLYHGDCREVLKAIEPGSVDAVVTDPPYELGFMGRKWDSSGIAFDPTAWAECLRVLKPGGHLLAFSGTRTSHRMVCAIEDAGFEIRDTIAWLYGSGFPKSLNLDGQWEGWGTALKPAMEPITVARKPLALLPANVLREVESQLRERGVRGEILWKPESASDAAKPKRTRSSDSTKPLGPSATSARTAGESATESGALQNLKSSESHGTSGQRTTRVDNESFQGCMTSDCADQSSQPTAGSAPVAESKSETFSPLTTSTVAEHSTESRCTERCMPNFGVADSLPDTESFAGIATGLTGSMATVRINRDSEGFFLWPKGLPEFVPGSPLTVAANVIQHGTGALNIDGCRVPTDDNLNGGAYSEDRKPSTSEWVAHGGTIHSSTGRTFVQPPWRWPANVIHDGSDEVLAAFPQAKGQQGAISGTEPSCKTTNAYGEFAGRLLSSPRGDTGSAARFFYCAKASKADRGGGNDHPTVKPTDLMRYLCRLITPPGGLVLDPFAGSGSTGKAAMLDGFRFVGCELDAHHIDIAAARISRAQAQGSLLTPDDAPAQRQESLGF